MLKFPKVPKWAQGTVANYKILGDCTLHVPLGQCATQKAIKDLAREIEVYIEAQAVEVYPEVANEYVKRDMKLLEQEYAKMTLRGAEIEKEHAALANKLILGEIDGNSNSDN